MSAPLHEPRQPAPIFVDTDIGCDDALAIAWLLRRPEARVVGFTSVYGNSSVQNVTANLLTLLDAMGLDIPVTVGASAPLAYPRATTAALVHGPDGLWGAQQARELEEVPFGAPGAIAAAAREHPGLTIIALGPLTNIARAVQAYPDDLRDVRLIVLGGSRHGGNVTPTAEFNIFADPHALAVILESGIELELITRDAFDQVLVDAEGLARRLGQEGGRAGALLARALSGYAAAITRGAGGQISIPDAAAVIYALYPNLGVVTPAAVRVVVDGDLTRGQTVVASTFNHRVALGLGATAVSRLADLVSGGGDLETTIADALRRAPDTVRVVLNVDGPAMVDLLEDGLMRVSIERAVGG